MGKPRSLISEETERELREAAEDIARGAKVETDTSVSLEADAPPVFPGVLSDEPTGVSSGPVTSSPGLPMGFTPPDLRAAVEGTDPEDVASVLPSVVAPADDPLAPQLPLSMEEPPAVTRIAMEQLMPDPKALEALQRLAGAAGHPERTRKALTNAFTNMPYDPRHLPEPRVMLVGIARVLVAHGLPADEMIEAIMASLTD